MSEERGTPSTNASVLTSRWSRGETGRQQRDTWTPLGSRLLTVALCLSPADMASSPCRLCLRPTGGCGWRLWMEKSLYDYIHLLSVSASTHQPNISIDLCSKWALTVFLALQIYTLPSLLSKKEESKCCYFRPLSSYPCLTNLNHLVRLVFSVPE